MAPRVELAVRLGAGAAHRRALAPVEQAELDAGASATRPITPSRASISRTRWPLPSPPIAGLHDIAPIGREAVRHQGRAGAHARRRGRGLAAGMPAADDDHVERSLSSQPESSAETHRQGRGNAVKRPNVSRETFRPDARLLADAEGGEEAVQHLLDVDPAGDPAERAQPSRTSSAASSE